MPLVISLPAGAVGLVGHRLVWFVREFLVQCALRMLVVFRFVFPPLVPPLEPQVSCVLIAVGGIVVFSYMFSLFISFSDAVHHTNLFCILFPVQLPHLLWCLLGHPLW